MNTLTKEDIDAAYEKTYDAIRPMALGCPVLELPGAPEAFAEAIAAIVRERCARIAEETAKMHCPGEPDIGTAEYIAAAIRKESQHG